MSVNNVNGANPYSPTYGVGSTQTTATNAAKNQSAAEEMAAKTEKKANEDSYVKSNKESAVTYKPDMNKVREMKASFNSKIGAFQQMVQNLTGKQIDFSKNVMQQMQNIIDGKGLDGSGKTNPAEDFFNDPDWGVEAVANRLVDFAKALSGGDPSKIAVLKDAVTKGFGAAADAWGNDGKMPSITQATYDRTMELFDEWENPPAETESEAVATE